MGRKPRIEYEGAIYHVIQRGNNRESVFERDRDKRYLLEKLRGYKEKMDFRLFGYVVMNNHYHLIIQRMSQPLHKVMHLVNNSYSKYYNLVYKRSGHVFEGRYKAILVQDERYVLTLLRYVHQNPVRAGICQWVWQYRWNSDMFYRQNLEGFVDIDLIFNILSENRVEAIKMYKYLMDEEETTDFDSVDIVGDEGFVLAVDTRKPVEQNKRLDEILLETGISYEDYKLIKSGSRKRYLSPYKAAYAKKSLEENYTLRQIAENIRLSESAVSKLLRQK